MMQKNLSERLEKRFQTLREANFADFHLTVRRFFLFFDSEPSLVDISKALATKFRAMNNRLSLYLTNLGDDLNVKSEDEAAAYGEVFLRKISESNSPPRQIYNNEYFRNLGHAENLPRQDENDERSLGAIRSRFLEPFYLYVIEQVSAINESVRQPHEIDPLTGMLRAEVFGRESEEKVLSAKSKKEPFALIFTDLDDFGAVNKTHGQQIGNEVLRTVASIIRRVVGLRSDCYRNGGEEFCIILENHLATEAVAFAERIRIEISNEPISERKLTITASIGVAGFPDHGETANDLFQKADVAMRHAKQLGKNRVQIWFDEERSNGRDSVSVQVPTAIKIRNVLTAPTPDIRVVVMCALVSNSSITSQAALSVSIQNHSPMSVFIKGVFFETQGDKAVYVRRDIMGQSLVEKRELRSGESIPFVIDPKDYRQFVDLGIINVVVRDDIDREYRGEEEVVKRNIRATLKGII